MTVEQQDGLWKVYEDGVHVESQTVRLHAEASAANRRDPNRQAQRRRQEWASALRDFASIVLSWVVVLCVLALIVAALSAVGGGEDSARSDSPASFCDTHDCIPSFDEGNGSIVQCTDGEWSHSGGIQGACSYHGGVR